MVCYRYSNTAVPVWFGLVWFGLVWWYAGDKACEGKSKSEDGSRADNGQHCRSRPEKLNLSHLHKTIMYEVVGAAVAPAHRSLGL